MVEFTRVNTIPFAMVALNRSYSVISNRCVGKRLSGKGLKNLFLRLHKHHLLHVCVYCVQCNKPHNRIKHEMRELVSQSSE